VGDVEVEDNIKEAQERQSEAYRPITEDTKQSILLRLAIKFFCAISSEPTEKVAKVL